MKRLICLLLAVAMLLSMAACGGQTSGGDTEPEETKKQSQGDSKETKPEDTEETKPSQPDTVTIQVPGKEVYFSCANGWVVDRRSQSTLVYQNEESLVSISYDWVNEFNGELEDLVTFLNFAFTFDAYSYAKGNIYGAQISTTDTERCTIGGYEAVRFTGTISNKGEWDCHVYGYTCTVDGVNLMICALVSTQAQDADMIAEIDALTDQIAASVRTEE